MHYYQFHIGDYRAATAHLSNEEDLAYRRLLDMYYDTEAPIPGQTQWVARRIRVSESVVISVLEDMFVKDESGVWRHPRADQEIARYKALEERNRTNGSKGGRPKKPTGLPVDSEPEPTGKATNNQQPGTKNQGLTGTDVPVCPADAEPAPEKGQKFPGCDHKAVLSLYHACLPNLPACEVWNDNRAGLLRQRWREVAQELAKEGPVDKVALLSWWERFFDHVGRSKFLTGKAPGGKDRKPFLADLEWLIRPNNFAKIIENRYHGD